MEGIKVIDHCGTLGELSLHNNYGHQRITKAHIDHSHAIACLERSKNVNSLCAGELKIQHFTNEMIYHGKSV